MKQDFILPKEVLVAIDKIKTDNKNNSIYLTKKAIELFINITEKFAKNSTEYFNKVLYNTAKKIVNAQPNMASIFNLTNQLLFINDLSKNMDEKCENIVHACMVFLKKIEISNKKIAQVLYESIKNKPVLITHSYSSTVYDSLIYLKEKGKDFNVICTESRPMMEGVKLAEDLGKNAINVTLISDSAVFSFIEDADMIIVGADSVCKEGIVNKIGTKGLALSSKIIETNFYCLSGLEKLFPLGIENLKINEPKNPSEILDKKLQNVKPINFYFDLTPLKYLTAIVTDAGIMKPEDLINKFLNFRIHDFLK